MIENIVLAKTGYSDIKININDFIVNNVEQEIKVMNIDRNIVIFTSGDGYDVHHVDNTTRFSMSDIEVYFKKYKRIYKIDKLTNI